MQKREIKKLVDSTADPAFAVNGLHSIEFWNRPAEEFFGIRSKDAIGKGCSLIVEGYDECGAFCTQDCSIIQASQDGKPIRNFDLQVKTSAGMKWCNISIIVATDDKAVAPHTIHILRPIDVSKRLEVLVRDFVVNETSMSEQHVKELTSATRTPARETNLTDRELEVIKLLAKGKTTKLIAEKLFISRTTVNNHVQHILKKLNAHSRLEAIRRAEHAGLL
ncbi:MAG: PAS domain-containing protein [Pyrinomonadaceae bacterium]|nr:PAS domain-containing protein [Pyrinomonadaceae bacterium]